MTPAELLALLITAFPNQRIEQPTQRLYLAHLAALPADRAERAIRELIVGATFLPAIAEIVRACGVHDEATRQLAEAVRVGKPLVPDLASMTGWAVGEAARPIPPPVDEKPALPAGPPISAEQRLQLREMTRAFANGHRVGGGS